MPRRDRCLDGHSLTRRVATVAAVTAALAATALSACGSGATAPSTTPSGPAQSPNTHSGGGVPSPTASTTSSAQVAIDACQLVTRDEAQAVVKTDLQAGVDNTDPSSPGCTYTSAPTGPTAQVEVHVADGAKQIYDTDRRIGHTFTPVPNLGDEGYIEDGAIFFRKGAVWVSIGVIALDVGADSLQAGMPGLARAALGRLPAGT